MVFKILRIREVLDKRGNRSRSSHYSDIQRGLFTPPVSIGSRAVGWPDYEVDTINAAKIAGVSDSEVRALVSELVANRKQLLSSFYRNVTTVVSAKDRGE